jgi:hypothetical protein
MAITVLRISGTRIASNFGGVRCLRDFCVIRSCFIVLFGEFATDIPRAWLLKINYLQQSKVPIFPSLRASNQVVGGGTMDIRGRARTHRPFSKTLPAGRASGRTELTVPHFSRSSSSGHCTFAFLANSGLIRNFSALSKTNDLGGRLKTTSSRRFNSSTAAGQPSP